MLDVTAFARSAWINDHVSSRCRIVLEFDGKVVETSFFVVTSNIRKLVKLAAVDLRQRNRHSTICGTFKCVPAHRKRRSNGLTAKPGCVDLDGVRSLSFNNVSRRDGPRVSRIDVCRNSAR